MTSTEFGASIFGLTFLGFYFVFLAALVAFRVITLWFLFKKAGVEGWKAIIPFYNDYMLYEISGINGWFFLLSFVPYAGVVFSILCSINLGYSFRKSNGFIVGLVLLPIIFTAILAFSKDKYTYDQKIYFRDIRYLNNRNNY